ncbi:Alpha/Beta hydrolase fold [Sesbania bispinosa]|nr:Alpha/Beta hydrolase fold [Sesbania bispinosa]
MDKTKQNTFHFYVDIKSPNGLSVKLLFPLHSPTNHCIVLLLAMAIQAFQGSSSCCFYSHLHSSSTTASPSILATRWFQSLGPCPSRRSLKLNCSANGNNGDQDYLLDAPVSVGDGFSFSGGKYSDQPSPSDEWFKQGKMVRAYSTPGTGEKAKDPIFGLTMGAGSQATGDRFRGSADNPSVILMHGFPSQVHNKCCLFTANHGCASPVWYCTEVLCSNPAYSYRKVLPVLSKDYHAIAFDWLGFGFSDKPQPRYGFDYTLDEYVSSLESLIDELAVTKVSLVVQGYFSPIVVKYANSHQEKLNNLILLNPPFDIAWQWNSLKNPNDKKYVTCDFCGKTTSGGITRAKRHQMGISGDVKGCMKTPADVKMLLKEAHDMKKEELTVLLLFDFNDQEEGKWAGESGNKRVDAQEYAQHAKLPPTLSIFSNFLLGEIFSQDPLRASDKALTSCGPYKMKEEDAMVYRRPYLTSGSSGFALNAISRTMKKDLKRYVEDMQTILKDKNWKVQTTICWGQRDRWLSYDGVEEFCKDSNHKLIEVPRVNALDFIFSCLS